VPHPITGVDLLLVAAEHVLGDYGTGAVMGVPWHDACDAVFAKANNISFGQPVLNDTRSHLINSGSFSGLTVSEAREKFAAVLQEKKLGEKHVSFKLRDWLVSRQRPWGAPIPVVHCKACGAVPVKESQLPVKVF
jgi:leucyl-tRNA synthetase